MSKTDRYIIREREREKQAGGGGPQGYLHYCTAQGKGLATVQPDKACITLFKIKLKY